MVIFEDIAAPYLLLFHVMPFLMGSVFWALGLVMMLMMIQSGKFQSMARMTNRIFLIGGLLFGIGFIAGGLLYPAFRLNVMVRPFVVGVAFPYVSFVFDGVLLFVVKQWVAAIGGLTFIGTIIFNSGDKRKTYISLALCLATLLTIVVDIFIAVVVTTTIAL